MMTRQIELLLLLTSGPQRSAPETGLVETTASQLVKAGYAYSVNGWLMLSENGLICAVNLGLLK
jgi:hypothetical protein